MPTPLALVGMPGCGKSTIGAMLAAALQQPFHDSDRIMEERSRTSIAAMFAHRGEPVFRRYERLTLRRLTCRYPAAVIATGGGAFAEGATRRFLLEHTLTVWLDVPPAQLIQRTLESTSRPLLNTTNPRKRLLELYDARLPCYRQAALHLDASGSSAGIVRALLATLCTRYA